MYDFINFGVCMYAVVSHVSDHGGDERLPSVETVAVGFFPCPLLCTVYASTSACCRGRATSVVKSRKLTLPSLHSRTIRQRLGI